MPVMPAAAGFSVTMPFAPDKAQEEVLSTRSPVLFAGKITALMIVIAYAFH